MVDKNREKNSKVVLDIELQDLLDIISKSNGSPSLNELSHAHMSEAEELKKAWYKHTLLSIEKLDSKIDALETDLKNDIKTEIQELERKAEKADTELKAYKKDVIEPINSKIIALTIKVSIWGALAGVVGSSIVTLIIYLVKEYLTKSIISGGP